jgi:exodeoxyribonuclease VII large subunit
MLHILTRRFSGFHLILNPVKVQGDGAAQEIAQAIRQFNQYNLVDVIIVGRGGGSIEDLWAFNEEIVADAIYQSQIPIISAVGHETDHCIADYVADVRAPTPSAAAELVIGEKDQHLKHLGQIQQRLQQTLRHLIRHHRQQLMGIARHPIFVSPYGILGAWMQKLDDLKEEIDDSIKQKISQLKFQLEAHNKHAQALKPTAKISQYHQKLLYFDKSLCTLLKVKIADWKKRLQKIQINTEQNWTGQQKNRWRFLQPEIKRKQIDQFVKRMLDLQKERMEKLADALHAVNPKNLLNKGYAIVFAEKGHSVITSVNVVEKKQDLRILLSDGELLSTVNEVIKSE